MNLTRRGFIGTSAMAAPLVFTGCSTAAVAGTPARTFGANELVKVGVIGLGRIGIGMDLPGALAYTGKCRITALCDLDRVRLDNGLAVTKKLYADKGITINDGDIKLYDDYLDLILNSGVDAVMICVPDHWHALAATAALAAGKHIWLQKPFAQTIREGRLIANLAKRNNLVVQVGAWQRSCQNFHDICELALNGRIGKIVRCEVGIGCDGPGGKDISEPVPATFNYEKWLGPTPANVPYNWTRCHNRDIKRIGDRPGWIQLAPYGWGMITNWGAHHIDILHWGLGYDKAGPDEVSGTCEWMDRSNGRLWNVHTKYNLNYRFGDTIVNVCNKHHMGVKFIGENGDWLYCERGGAKVTPSDPKGDGKMGPFMASKLSLLEPLADPKRPLKKSTNHFGNWLDAIRAGDPSMTVCDVEAAHRSTSSCSLCHMVMELGRGKKDGATIKWNSALETTGTAEGDALMKPFSRDNYDLGYQLKKYFGLDAAKLMKA